MGDEEAAKELAAEEAQIELFKIKRLIKSLERARGFVILRALFCGGSRLLLTTFTSHSTQFTQERHFHDFSSASPKVTNSIDEQDVD